MTSCRAVKVSSATPLTSAFDCEEDTPPEVTVTVQLPRGTPLKLELALTEQVSWNGCMVTAFGEGLTVRMVVVLTESVGRFRRDVKSLHDDIIDHAVVPMVAQR